MHPDLHRRVVKIRRDSRGDQPGALATGFAFSASRILTCAHILKGGAAIQVCFIEEDPDRWLDVTLIWNGRDSSRAAETDVAVLKVVDPSWSEKILDATTRPWLARQVFTENQHWTSRGIPKVAATRDSKGKLVPRVTDYGGIVYPADSNGMMTVEVSKSPGDPVDWAGASGSPVLVGCRLIGILVNVPAGWKGERLTGIWLGALLADADFAAAIGFRDEQGYQLRLVRKVAEVLKKPDNQPLCLDLANRLPLPTPAPDLIADHLCSMDAAKLLKLARAVLDGLVPEAEAKESTGDLRTTDVAVDFMSIVNGILPSNSNPEELDKRIEEHEKRAPGQVLDLPVGKKATVVLQLAKRDRKPVEFNTEALSEDMEPEGRSGIPYDMQDGFGQTPARLAKLLCDIASAAGVSVELNKESSPEALADMIRPVLDDHAKPEFGARADHWHLIFRREDDRPHLGRLKELLPSLDVVHIEGTPLPREAVLESHLRKYLQLVFRLERLLERRRK